MIPAGWHRKTEYSLERGPWSIAKFIVQGVVSYGLFRAGASDGYFDSAQDAADEAERLDSEEHAHASTP